VVSGFPGFAARIEAIIKDVLCRRRDADLVAADVVEMRRAIAEEKGDAERWNLKYVAGGLVDLEFIAQYLQLVHAADEPEILDPSTARALDKAFRLGVLGAGDAEILRPAARLYHNLTQILRLCLSVRSIRKPPAPACSACSPAPPTCRIFPRSRRILRRRRRACGRALCGSWPGGVRVSDGFRERAQPILQVQFNAFM